jgi:tRNA-2-methylthio-N6-dimethylallyladenosine synthase
VQSGSDKVLKAMRRGHTIENYKKRIDIIKNSPRNISLTTDIIVGFPGESEEDFEATCRLYEYCQYDMAYIFKYSVRSGTPAAEIPDDVALVEKTRRFLELENILKTFQAKSLQSFVGKTVEVLVERVSSKNSDDLTGHTTCQKIVNFRGKPELPGNIVKVRITESKSNTLYGVTL